MISSCDLTWRYLVLKAHTIGVNGVTMPSFSIFTSTIGEGRSVSEQRDDIFFDELYQIRDGIIDEPNYQPYRLSSNRSAMMNVKPTTFLI